jgi:molybdopterin-guanine dinucleotide biosynthesis protein A
MRGRSKPIGAILAGGAGIRIGGDKATVELQGRPLISYPLEAVRRAIKDVTILAKADTKLPYLDGVTVWIEPEYPRHPLVGITQALALADGRPVVTCAADLPFVTPGLIRRLARTNPGRSGAVIACARGRMQPLLGCYRPWALEPLSLDARRGNRPLQETIGLLNPVLIEVEDPDELFNVNSPDDLLMAAAMLDRRRLTYSAPDY